LEDLKPHTRRWKLNVVEAGTDGPGIWPQSLENVHETNGYISQFFTGVLLTVRKASLNALIELRHYEHVLAEEVLPVRSLKLLRLVDESRATSKLVPTRFLRHVQVA